MAAALNLKDGQCKRESKKSKLLQMIHGQSKHCWFKLVIRLYYLAIVYTRLMLSAGYLDLYGDEVAVLIGVDLAPVGSPTLAAPEDRNKKQ